MSNSKIIAVSIFALTLVGCANTGASENTQRPGDHSTAFADHGTPVRTGPVPAAMAADTLPEAPGYGMMIPYTTDPAPAPQEARAETTLQARR
jgi:hypothetical protein